MSETARATGEYLDGQIVGFALYRGLSEAAADRAEGAIRRALQHFPDLQRHTMSAGNTTVHVWGHNDITSCLRTAPAGTLQMVVGGPHGRPSWRDVDEGAEQRADSPQDWSLPWEGRCIVWQIDPNTNRWESWNDWVGAIPVFHAAIEGGMVASSLEPIVAATVAAGPHNFLRRGVYCLLALGHCIGNDTLFENILALPGDVYARWEGATCNTQPLRTLQPSDERWHLGMRELTDQCHDMILQAVSRCRTDDSRWIISLSGGMDSRLITGTAARLGVPLRTYTFGDWDGEIVYARRIARILGLPWRRVKLGTTYVADYGPMWGDWFGSSLFWHGMFQIAIMKHLTDDDRGMLLTGFPGDPLSGSHIRRMDNTANNEDGLGPLRNVDSFWSAADLQRLLRFDCREPIAELTEIVEQTRHATEGPAYQRMLFFDVWTRQRRYVSYFTHMHHYFRPNAVPYLDRDYAQFCASLPRAAMEDRLLHRTTLSRHFPEITRTVGATFDIVHRKLTAGHFLLRALASVLPQPLRIGSLRQFGAKTQDHTTDCFVRHPRESLWPVTDMREQLGDLMDPALVEEAYQQAQRGGTTHASARIATVQAIAFATLRPGHWT